jgi:hypothetical protein
MVKKSNEADAVLLKNKKHKKEKVKDAAPSTTQSQRKSVIATIGDGGNDKHLYKDGKKQ